MVITISKAKASFAEIINRTNMGETFVITKNGKPVADVVPHTPSIRRNLGFAKDEVEIKEGFDEADTEIEKMFYGDSE